MQKIVLLFDQLDDIDADDYLHKIYQCSRTMKDVFQCSEISEFVFVRKENADAASYRKLKIDTELTEIQDKLQVLGLEEEGLRVKIIKINDVLEQNGHKLVLLMSRI